MGLVGGYSLHLYCDHPEHVSKTLTTVDGEIDGSSHRECVATARREGWKIDEKSPWRENKNGSGKAICPVCRKR